MKYFKDHARDIVLIGLLVVVALVTRTVGLGAFLTADEKLWLERSSEFVRAFKDARFNDMLQTTHPGVTTLWVAGAAMTAKMIASDISFSNEALFHFIKSSQFSIAFLNSIAVPAFYILLFAVFKRRDVAFISTLFIALDPLLIGYSRVVHVDALLGSFLTLAVLASILYARSLERKWLIISAVLSAFALLTKIPAVFIIPFIVCALVAFHGKALLASSFLKKRFHDGLIWILIVTVLVIAIWPALLWVPNPVGNALVVKRDVSIAAATPHNMSEEYSLNALHYPSALITRSNPISLIGGVIGIVAILVLAYKRKVPREAALIALYLFGFIIMMTLGAKKGDRYILPVYFALNILAAYGILWLTALLTPSSSPLVRGRERRRIPLLTKEGLGEVSRAGAVVTLLSTTYLLSVVISYHPYAIAYSSPLFPDNLSQELGWGEGLDQVAVWLNENHPDATVASWYPGELGAFTTAKTLHINAHEQNQVQFIVLYKNMFGREPSHYANDFIDEYFKKREPVFTAHIAGKEFAWVYEKPSYPKTIGDLDAETIVVQEAVADYENLAGVRMFTATRLGEANTGTMVVSFARSLQGAPFYTKELQIAELEDATWNTISFPKSIAIEKGEHVFIRIRAIGSQKPYATLRYVPEAHRTTPIYISRTGSIGDATQKPGSLSIQLIYKGIDGQIRTELETRLLK